ncbi:MAG TPA: M56 family metallopeptidase, partial [Vicinamibacterales bacterium]|nr:M56 family metallopeptidase [Vicinamibacterales bacterium]
MTMLLDVALRSSAPILAALLACVLLRRRSAALRHSVLAAAVVAAAAMVPLSIALPSWEVRVPDAPFLSSVVEPGDADPLAPQVTSETPQATSETTSGGVTVVTATAASPNAGATAMERVFLVWMLGVAIGATLLLLAVARLVRMTRQAEALVDGRWRRLADDIAVRYHVRRPIVLLATRVPGVLATWGLLKPRVLLPAHARGWSSGRARAALSHELAHIRRCDWPVQVAADVLRV